MSKTFDNIKNKVIDDLRIVLKGESKVSVVAASFSMYAFQALKKELEQVEEVRFLFSGDVFTKENAQREAREFYIPRLHAERSLYGTAFEVKLRNELTQQAIAKECAEWIRRKVKFKANVSGENMSPFLTVRNKDEQVAYHPFHNFTTAELGEDRGNNAYAMMTKIVAPDTQYFFDTFDSVWNSKEKLTDVTDAVLENITAAYQENSPEFIYYTALYNIFREFLEDLNADFLPDEATGFKDSAVWKKLYNFQKDAVIGSIAKLEKHNGCILADSVGLGKTFTALGVIKYYEMRNKNVLVLCPKRLQSNWNVYKGNYKNNPLQSDRLRYDVLFHTDLSRNSGASNGLDLRQLHWSNYDLVVIDESHNFRNGERTTHAKDDAYENRYQKLLNRVIKEGVKTKVLMLSATPVNTRFTDLKNQLMLAAEGDSDTLDGQLDTHNPVDKIFRDAESAFNAWSTLPSEVRTTQHLLGMLHFDFFELLDSVTIARSRRHIEKYYADAELGTFPERFKPLSFRPELTTLPGIDFNRIFTYIDSLNLDIYTPMKYVHPSRLGKYIDLSTNEGRSWANRETGRNVLMITNLLKRIESSIYAFRLTTQHIYDVVEKAIIQIENFIENGAQEITVRQDEYPEAQFDSDDTYVGKKFKIALSDMDYVSWRRKLEEDRQVLAELLKLIEPVSPEQDMKLHELSRIMEEKIQHPINHGNKKIIIFTAFADTAKYLYDSLAQMFLEKHGLHVARVTGSDTPTSTLKEIPADFNTILTCFSPISKDRAALYPVSPGDIDILIATDCISEGQNLQDCDYLINYDIHWNPVRIIQRFGRIDRIGSPNTCIQLANFWPNISLDDYIKLKSRVENRMKLVNLTATGSDNPIDQSDNAELEYRAKQLEKIQNEVVDLEDMDSGVSIMDLGLNEFHMDLQALLKKYGEADRVPFGIHAVVAAEAEIPAGVIFILKNINQGVNVDQQNRLHPFYMVYIADDESVVVHHLQPKDVLDTLRYLTLGKDTSHSALVTRFNAMTKDGKDTRKYTALLTKAIQSMITQKEEADTDSLFTPGGTTALQGGIRGLDDFELVNFLVVQ